MSKLTNWRVLQILTNTETSDSDPSSAEAQVFSNLKSTLVEKCRLCTSMCSILVAFFEKAVSRRRGSRATKSQTILGHSVPTLIRCPLQSLVASRGMDFPICKMKVVYSAINKSLLGTGYHQDLYQTPGSQRQISFHLEK